MRRSQPSSVLAVSPMSRPEIRAHEHRSARARAGICRRRARRHVRRRRRNSRHPHAGLAVSHGPACGARQLAGHDPAQHASGLLEIPTTQYDRPADGRIARGYGGAIHLSGGAHRQHGAIHHGSPCLRGIPRDRGHLPRLSAERNPRAHVRCIGAGRGSSA
jgi:hypothetical protein